MRAQPFGVVSNNNISGLEPLHVSNVMALGAYALEDEARKLFSYPPHRIIADQRT